MKKGAAREPRLAHSAPPNRMLTSSAWNQCSEFEEMICNGGEGFLAFDSGGCGGWGVDGSS